MVATASEGGFLSPLLLGFTLHSRHSLLLIVTFVSLPSMSSSKSFGEYFNIILLLSFPPTQNNCLLLFLLQSSMGFPGGTDSKMSA